MYAIRSYYVPDSQRTLGYSVQSFLINTGAVVGSVLPYILTNVLNVNNSTIEGEVPPSVISYNFV